MYKDQHSLPEETVAHLFTTGFLAAAISASFVGTLADKHGRRSACLVFCVLYSISCLAIVFDSIIILFAGRILGGIATTLMYSVIESWMVTEYHKQHLNETGGLSDIFGIMTALNGLVAIASGLFAEAVTDFFKTQSAPFMTAIVCLTLAYALITKHWVGQSSCLLCTFTKKPNRRARIMVIVLRKGLYHFQPRRHRMDFSISELVSFPIMCHRIWLIL